MPAIFSQPAPWHERKTTQRKSVNLRRSRRCRRRLRATEKCFPTAHLELSGAVGYGINGTNPVTHYRNGNELHVELAAGKRLSPHGVAGLAGYAYRQVTPDRGVGGTLGGPKGRVFGVVNHFHGDVAMVSATVRL